MDATATTAVALAGTGDSPRPSPQDTANAVQVPWNGYGTCLYGLCASSCPSSGDSKASARVHATGLPLLDWTVISASPDLLQFDAQGSSNMLWAPAEAAHEHRPFTDAASSASTASLPLLATSAGVSNKYSHASETNCRHPRKNFMSLSFRGSRTPHEEPAQ